MTTNTSKSSDELEFGQLITLNHMEIVPLEIEYFWSAFDNYFEFLKSFSGRTDVELETDNDKPKGGPGAIVRFDFQGSLVRNRLLYNDRKNHVWKMDIPEATNLFTLYIVTFKANKVDDNYTQVSITVELVLQSRDRQARADALQTLRTYLPKRIGEILRFLQRRDGDKFKLAPINELEIKQLAADFYEKLDSHAPVEEVTQFLDLDASFKMRFPSLTLRNREEFEQWYQGNINVFFDEIHMIKALSIKDNTQVQANSDAIVHWEGSSWKAPGANSKRFVIDEEHSWSVVRSSDFKPIYKKYIVHRLNYAQGSHRL